MSDLRYFKLSIPAPKRLALMRKVNPDWRKARYWTLTNYAAAFGLSSHGFNERNGNRVPVLYSFDGASIPVRSIHFCDDVARIGHKGWLADDDGCRGVVRGIVGSLPHGRFLSGYRESNNDSYVLFIGHIFDNANDAAHDGDSEAEFYAEQCRDSNARFDAMTEAESLVESKESDLCAAWEDYRAAWSAYLENPQHANAAVHAREWVKELISDLRAFRRELVDATNAYNNG